MSNCIFDINISCTECTRVESFHIGESNIIRAANNNGCVERSNGEIIKTFTHPSQIKEKFGDRISKLICGAGENQ